jgi:hypothetical protein
MNRNTTLTLIFTIMLMVSFSIQANSAKADSNEPIGFSSGLTLYSPLNKTYNSSLLQLNLTFESRAAGLQGFLNYSIDGKYQGPIPLTFNSFGLGYGLVQLPEFSNGPHVLTINVGFYYNSDYSGSYVHTIYFTINASEVISNSTTPSTPVIPEHFTVNQKLWAFDGFHLVCSFNATANQHLEFNILAYNSDPERPSDVFLAEFKIESINHGTSYVSGNMLSQKVNLNYTDTYTIFVVKHPFYATITVTGTIDLKPNDNIINPTISSSLTPTLSPELSPTHSSSPSSYPEQPFLMPTQSANQTSSNDAIHKLDPALVLCSIVAILVVATFALVYFEKHKQITTSQTYNKIASFKKNLGGCERPSL